MPGKVNPVIPEVVTQVGAQVMGNDAAIAFAGSQGNFELNVFVPVIARNLLESIALLTSACTVFADKCIAGIEANVDTARRRTRSRRRRSAPRSTRTSATRRRPRSSRSRRAPGKSIREIVQRAQADDRRRARPRARRRGDDPGRHHRMSVVRTTSAHVDHGSRRAIIAAFLANLGIALQQVRRVRRSPARRRCWPRRSTRSPTPATRACYARRQRVAPAGRRACTRSATAPLRYFWAFVVALVLFSARRRVRDLRRHREAAPPARARGAAGWRSACCSSRWCSRRSRSAPRSARADAERPRASRCSQFVRRTKIPELPVVLLEDIGALIGLVLRAGRRRARRA